jgi:ATP/ADP translocase
MPKRMSIASAAGALPLLILAYALLMLHYVFSRAFRDSLLGSHLSVSALPSLTFIGTLLAITISLALSFFLRTDQRIRVIRAFYGINALVETILAFGYTAHPWMYRGYYVEVSASTALGLSLIWVLIGDWMSKCGGNDIGKVPTILICGTSAGTLCGFGLVHLPSAVNFRVANLILASINSAVLLTLLLYRNSYCNQEVRLPIRAEVEKALKHWTSAVVRTLAVVTILGASASTLMDLVFRVAVANHFASQTARLHFLGLFQGLLSLGSLLSQLALQNSISSRFGRAWLAVHPLTVTLAGLIGVILPVFPVLAILRAGEYSLRNSAFRCGVEMVYANLPDNLRVETRPLIDVVGERIGDMIAAGLLALLLMGSSQPGYRPSLLMFSFLGFALWGLSRWLIRRMDQMAEAFHSLSTQARIVSLHRMAKQDAVLA